MEGRRGGVDAAGDDAEGGGGEGRVRSFAHVDGNFATYVRAPVGRESLCEKVLDGVEAMERAFPGLLRACVEDEGSGRAAASSARDRLAAHGAHASLSRVFPVRWEEIKKVEGAVRRALVTMDPFEVVFDAFKVFVNDDGTRAFVAAGFEEGSQSASKRAFVDAIERINLALESLGFPRYYDDPDPHVSLLWVAHASEETVDELRRAVKELKLEWRLRVGRIVLDVSGLPDKLLWGRVIGGAGKLPLPEF
jgi:2'-5' RNA ligase